MYVWETLSDCFWSIIWPHRRNGTMQSLELQIRVQQSMYETQKRLMEENGAPTREQIHFATAWADATLKYGKGLITDHFTWRTIRDARAEYVKDLEDLNESMRAHLVDVGVLDQTVWEPDAITLGDGWEEHENSTVSKQEKKWVSG
ncbi:uncharacterized protein PpBr36_09544 [Pyricularia pennisetigena]|uniref:uncharacterized protein n=1 Tax=Pyricularia pennisetigena TaxID=1578925 RepID=UPI00114DFBFF|nr:uncharacterized protein PpBr36_09544 [Pyricularia pennisetigena]TLS21860.1 hypothetical protein PpBr36_09544 [Pyricularia pennisetigena]